jgi:hypothetical protein
VPRCFVFKYLSGTRIAKKLRRNAFGPRWWADTWEYMRGSVTTKDLIFCARIIIVEFGMAVYLRAVAKSLFNKKPITFLECLVPDHFIRRS